jgi:hypothetical protein
LVAGLFLARGNLGTGAQIFPHLAYLIGANYLDLFIATSIVFLILLHLRQAVLSVSAQQSLPAEGAIAWCSSSAVPFSLNANRAPQLKASVGLKVSTICVE